MDAGGGDLADVRDAVGDVVEVLQVKGMPASMATARVCRTVLVEPPMAMSRTKAFSKAARVRMSQGRMFLATRLMMAAPAAWKSRSRAGSVARMVPLPGRARPRASQRQFMELAVNMPEQEPQVGQACCFEFGELCEGHFAGGVGADAFEDGDQVDGFAGGGESCRPSWGRRRRRRWGR